MDLSRLKTQLIVHEGKRNFPYKDSVGLLTIGVGRNLTDVGLSDITITQMLDEDIMKTIAFLTKNCPWWLPLDEVRQRAITDLTFNIMGKILDFHQMISAIEAKNWDRAADELLNSTFAHQTGQRAIDLANQLRTGHD